MTDLTDKWKKGELPDGLYYVKTNGDSVMILGWSKFAGWYNIKQVLAPVPTFEEWQSMDRLEKIMLQERARLNKQVTELLGKNKQLKELLKECLEVLEMVAGETRDFPHTVDDCIDKISQALGEDK